MPRRANSLPLALPPRQAGESAIRWLCRSLRTEILEGRLRPESRLPATRDLAGQYGLARGTVVSAFEELKAEGYLRGAVGSGTRVSEVLPDELLQPHRRATPAKSNEAMPPLRRYSDYGRRAALIGTLDPLPSRAFRAHQPALDLFPTSLWAQLAARRWRRTTMSDLLGCPTLGYPPLRQAIADYLNAARGVRCGPEQIAIVTGVQEALELTARLFVNPGDRVGLEEPGYLGAWRIFQALGARLASLPVDAEGLRLPARSADLRLLYTTPAHQFPLGTAMSLPRRLALLDWARRAGVPIFEDDYDSEYRYSGRPLPALQGLDRHGVVFFAGSFNKVLFPSLRLGYLVVPPDAVERVEAMRSVAVRQAPSRLEQAVLCDFLTAGHFGRHIRRTREIYATRLGALTEAARQHLAGQLELSEVEAGLQTVGWLQAPQDVGRLTRRAEERRVEITPLSHYARRPLERDGLLLGFAAVRETELRRGVRELAQLLERR